MSVEFYIVPALYDRDTYFLFRDYGNEIKFTVIEGKITIIGNGFFVPKELEFIKDNFL
ncbi:hypothetical protein [Flavobacterium sp. FlaQc-50]|uniref:hypothetical protein n=1 Tax=unclassified Flavobacterium TaxID=196869 RepID=UPI003756DFEB